MAVLFRYIGFSCIVFLALQQMTTGLQCYVCNGCISPTSLTTVASGSGYSCTKTTTMVKGSVFHIVRAYTITGSCTESNGLVDGIGVLFNCCATDGCNAGAALSSSLGLALALIAAVGVFKTVMAN